MQSTPRPEDATWPAAKASGLVAVLPNQEVEGWDRVDAQAQMTERMNDDRNKAGEDFRAVADRLGVSVAPGATVRVTPEERDELMRAMALYYETDVGQSLSPLPKVVILGRPLAQNPRISPLFACHSAA